ADKRLQLLAMTLLLATAAVPPASSAADQLEPAPVVDQRDRLAAEDLDPLLRHGRVTVGEVLDARNRAAREGNLHDDRVVQLERPAAAERLGRDAERPALGERAREVEEVAELADDASATGDPILRPVPVRQRAGVDTAGDGPRHAGRQARPHRP